ncbi:MAG: PspA-associated protein PspAB [Thermoleophilaceae bacterium]|nr:hypothetical protein [Thermoleophilaceae bacterium]
MGLLDALLGGQRKLKAPAPDRLFAMSTAQVTLEVEVGLQHRQRAGIVFQPIATGDFRQILQETEELLRGAAKDTGTEIESHDDKFGYRWLILRDADFEDLVVSLNTVSTQLQGGGYGDRLLACVFAFEQSGGPVYFIYNFKRGAFYPFVTRGEETRDTEAELRLMAQLRSELPLEEEIGRRLPLWDIPL